MRKLSTGDPSTLGSYRKWAALIFGDDSPAVTYLDKRIAAEGEDMEVIADERQLVSALERIHDTGQMTVRRA